MSLKSTGPEALSVPARGGIHLIACSGRTSSAKRCQFRIVHAQFLSANMNCILVGSFTDSLSSHFNTISQNVSESLSFSQFFGHGDHGLMVAPLQLNTSGVLFGNQTLLVTLGSEGDNAAG